MQRDLTNLEDYVTYTWASVNLVREGVYEVVFGESLMLSPGDVQFVYFSAGGKDILGCSPLLSVRWNINISPSFQITYKHFLRYRQFSPSLQTEQAREAVEGEL